MRTELGQGKRVAGLQQRRLRVIACFGAMLVSLAGCGTTDLLSAGPKEQIVTSISGKGKGQVILVEDKRLPPRTTISLDAPESRISDSAPENYVREILKELIAQVPKDLAHPIEVNAFLMSYKGSAHFYATSGNDILAGYSALPEFKSRDELAFTLAHELAHILLEHNTDQESIFSLDTAVKLTDKLLMLARTYETVYGEPGQQARQLNPDEQRSLAKHVLEIRISAHALRSSIAGILQGAWTRSQEREADRLGYDLLIAAGYNGGAAGDLLDRFGSTPSLREEVKKHVDKMEKAGRQLVAVTDEGRISMYLKQAGISGLAEATRGLLNLIDDTHKSAPERKRDLFDGYVKKLSLTRNTQKPLDKNGYAKDIKRMNLTPTIHSLEQARENYLLAEAGLPPNQTTAIVSGVGSRLAFNRYALYRIRKTSGKSSSALRNLRIAWANDPTAFSTSAEYAVELAARNRTAEANKVIAFLEETYPSDAPLEDIRGRVLAQQKDHSAAKEHLAKCDLHKKPHIRSRCERVLDELETQEEEKRIESQMRHSISQADSSSDQPVRDVGEKAMDALEQLKKWIKNGQESTSPGN